MLNPHQCALPSPAQACAMEENSMVDFKALEKELQAALAADEKYKRENAAKFRAVAQRVPSYEDFRGIVLASHLKPLERKDKMSGKRTAPWNCHATRRKTFQEDVAVEVSEAGGDALPAWDLSRVLPRLAATLAEWTRALPGSAAARGSHARPPLPDRRGVWTPRGAAGDPGQSHEASRPGSGAGHPSRPGGHWALLPEPEPAEPLGA
ncbi:PREDICTED: coiled-coil domain-containing protein 103 isoform X3 [Chinchilla lanigera]|uniref:coiled-coil domain-containing protein 103 isoform X3 n=1 Tax=Chinchilla lanigera TaxID=34839 RepID=UPI00038E968C|nr:PREDICTED: coiled-coil domain-containing protein 103 isoform X3 [Chinchilla lanigera]